MNCVDYTLWPVFGIASSLLNEGSKYRSINTHYWIKWRVIDFICVPIEVVNNPVIAVMRAIENDVS